MRIPTSAVSPPDALARVAEAVPPDVRGNIIVIGSLAAGYQLLRDQPDYEVRTKDVDCVIAPLTRPDDLDEWPEIWRRGLETCFPGTWRELATDAGLGVRALLDSDVDLQEAVFTANNGLLANRNVDADAFRAAGERLIAFVAEPLADAARKEGEPC